MNIINKEVRGVVKYGILLYLDSIVYKSMFFIECLIVSNLLFLGLYWVFIYFICIIKWKSVY